jgi:Protein of unknown function (DUF4446)
VTTADTALDVAIGAAGAAGLLLLVTLYLWVQVRRMRRAQKVVIGSSSGDLVEYAMSLLARVEHAENTAGAAESAVRALSQRVDGCFERRALLRYDALEGAGPKQSVTIALMDASRSGYVLSAIQGRDYARIYIKDVKNGLSDVELSPEEKQVLAEATT